MQSSNGNFTATLNKEAKEVQIHYLTSDKYSTMSIAEAKLMLSNIRKFRKTGFKLQGNIVTSFETASLITCLEDIFKK
jgi:hypothetical protein